MWCLFLKASEILGTKNKDLLAMGFLFVDNEWFYLLQDLRFSRKNRIWGVRPCRLVKVPTA